jgi:hypothetical protein
MLLKARPGKLVRFCRWSSQRDRETEGQSVLLKRIVRGTYAALE